MDTLGNDVIDLGDRLDLSIRKVRQAYPMSRCA